jgi:RAT1-interacting protein
MFCQLPLAIFLHYICLNSFSDKPDGVPDVRKPVNESEELCVMFRTKLSNHHLLFGAEMDGVKSMTAISNYSELAEAEFIELKTSRQIETARQNHNFKR